MAWVAIDKTAWDAKLILTADLASPVSYGSLCHLLMTFYINALPSYKIRPIPVVVSFYFNALPS